MFPKAGVPTSLLLILAIKKCEISILYFVVWFASCSTGFENFCIIYKQVCSFANLRDAVIETPDVTENAMLMRPS